VTQETLSDSEEVQARNAPKTFNPETNARVRDMILEAVQAHPGIGYSAIRYWIKEHKRFTLENVGGRCRELAREEKPARARIEYDGKGHVHVYLVEESQRWRRKTEEIKQK